MNALQTLYHSLQPWLPLVTTLGVVMALLSLVAIPLLVLRLPADYFSTTHKPKQQRHTIGWLLWLLRNGAAAVLILAGILMLILPGQGLITILLGIACSTFPGKYRLERRIVAQQHVFASLNWVRRKYHRPPLIHPAPCDQ